MEDSEFSPWHRRIPPGWFANRAVLCRKGHKKVKLKRSRTFIRCERLVNVSGCDYFEITIPSWNKTRRAFLPVTSVPHQVLQTAKRGPDNKLRFFANVNLEAGSEDDLGISDVESFDLAPVFQRQAQ